MIKKFYRSYVYWKKEVLSALLNFRCLGLLGMIKCRKRYARFVNYIEGKNVAIVGPANTAQQHPDQLEFDVVIRLNNAIYSDSNKTIGDGRTEVLFHSFDSDRVYGSKIEDRVIEKNKIRYVVFSHTDLIKIKYVSKTPIPLVILKRKYFTKLKECLNGKYPTTGAVAIDAISNLSPKLLYLTGFSFYQTEYSGDYREINDWKEYRKNLEQLDNHNFRLEKEYLLSLIKKKSSLIVVDDYIKGLL